MTATRESGVQLGGDVARNMIVAGAARVFAMHGFRATSVEDLLAASTVSRRTFYRLFKSKDDVALALYHFGTAGLLDTCRRGIAGAKGPLAQLETCVDAHLKNASGLGRLIFVLGGEAQRLESPLHARRMAVHDQMVELLREGDPATAACDPLLIRALIFALEQTVRVVLEEGDEGRRVTPAAIERARRVMMRVATASALGSGPGVAPLPTLDLA